MLNFRAFLIAAGAFAASFLAAAVTHTEEVPKRAPYHAIRWEGGDPVVRIGGEWLTLVSIDGIAVEEVLEYCREKYDEKWRKRFEEDLVEVLIGIGHEPGETVQLVVRDQADARTRTLEDVAMTYENRQAIWYAAQAYGPKSNLRDPYPKAAPYDAIRWEADEPVVRIDGEWVTLVSIDGVAVGEIIAYCRDTYDEKWRKRFEEDLVEALIRMGHPPGQTVRLTVRESDESEAQTLEGVAMTTKNRQAIWIEARSRQWTEQARERGHELLRELESADPTPEAVE